MADVFRTAGELQPDFLGGENGNFCAADAAGLRHNAK
jgi:hypothetical protein